MRKKIFMAIAAVMFLCGLATVTTSCDEKDENETNSEWMLRNSINGVGWSAKRVKVNGNWISDDSEEYYAHGLAFDIKFSASNRNFKCTKYYYLEKEGADPKEYIADEFSRESYTYGDGTAYTIKGQVVEATVSGNPFFKMEVLEEPKSTLHCIVTFYKDNRSFEIEMDRVLL